MVERTPLSGAPDRRALLLFVAFSHGWTFAFYALAGLAGPDVWRPPGWWLFLVGGAGVLLAAVVTTAVTAGRAGLRDLARRTVDPRRAALGWWLAALCFAPGTTVIAALVAAAAGVDAPLSPSPVTTDLPAALGAAALLLVLGPLPEEIGWRGVLLDRLLRRSSPVRATAVVVALWWTWHLPLHLLPGYFAPFAHPPDPWAQLAGLAAASVLMTWLYRETDRSVLVAVAFHWSGNLTGEWLRPAPAVDAIQLALTIPCAAAVLVTGFPRLGNGRGER